MKVSRVKVSGTPEPEPAPAVADGAGAELASGVASTATEVAAADEAAGDEAAGVVGVAGVEPEPEPPVHRAGPGMLYWMSET